MPPSLPFVQRSAILQELERVYGFIELSNQRFKQWVEFIVNDLLSTITLLEGQVANSQKGAEERDQQLEARRQRIMEIQRELDNALLTLHQVVAEGHQRAEMERIYEEFLSGRSS